MMEVMLAGWCVFIGYLWGRADQLEKMELQWERWIEQRSDGWLAPVRRLELIKENPPDEAA